MTFAPLFTGSAWPLPRQIPNLVFWLDADDDTMFTGDAVSGEIATLTTKDANAYPFSPVSATASTRLIRARKTNWNNRKVICSQQQSACGLVSNNNIDIATLFAANGTDHTAFVVCRSDDSSGNANGAIYYHYTSGAIGHYLEACVGGTNFRYLSLSTTYTTQLITVTNGLENIFCLRRTGNTLQIYMNGVQLTSIASTATPIVSTLTTMKLFCPTTSGGGYHGDVAEILMYNRSLSDSERIQMENNLARKWFGLD